MTHIDAMKQGLEALKVVNSCIDDYYLPKEKAWLPEIEQAITSLRQAIEQAEKQEPVAWIEHHKGGDNLEWENPGGKCTPLYTTPPAAPMQEPVAEARFDGTLHWREPYGIGLHRIQGPLYTTPQQRTWVGLTDEEENALIPDPDGSAEVNVKHVEVLPGAWGAEFEEVDAWSKPLVLQMLHNHEAKLKQKNGYAEENT